VPDDSLRPRPASGYALIEIEAACRNHGWRVEVPNAGPWLARTSARAPGTLRLAALDGDRFAVRAPTDGVAAGLRADGVEFVNVSGVPAAVAHGSGELMGLVSRCYRLAVSLPDAPLDEFRRRLGRDRESAEINKVADGLGSTEVERTVRQRVGQEVFRSALLEHWDNTCPLTRISDERLLRASHVVPWARCGSDGQRLSVFNGLLLSALWDAAFDRGLVSFDGTGRALASDECSREVRDALKVKDARLPRVACELAANLEWHREHVFESVVAEQDRRP